MNREKFVDDIFMSTKYNFFKIKALDKNLFMSFLYNEIDTVECYLSCSSFFSEIFRNIPELAVFNNLMRKDGYNMSIIHFTEEEFYLNNLKEFINSYCDE